MPGSLERLLFLKTEKHLYLALTSWLNFKTEGAGTIYLVLFLDSFQVLQTGHPLTNERTNIVFVSKLKQLFLFYHNEIKL